MKSVDGKKLRKINSNFFNILENIKKLDTSSKKILKKNYSNIFNSEKKDTDKKIDDKKDAYLFKKRRKKRASKSQRNLKIMINQIQKKFQIKLNSIPGKKNGDIKKNKDNYFKLENILGDSDNLLVGVLDGNGPNGFEISNFVKSEFIEIFKKLINNNFIFNKENTINLIKENYKLIKESLKKQGCNLLTSGLSISFVLILNKFIFTSNIGNSKIVLIKEKIFNKIKIVSLTKIHDFNNKSEHDRIKLLGGEFKLNKLIEFRVFKKGKAYPNLKMTRCIGNYKSKSIGIIDNPFISVMGLKNEPILIILGTYGLWKNISENLLINSYDSDNIDKFCNKLSKISKKEWLKNNDFNDDLTCCTITYGHNKYY